VIVSKAQLIGSGGNLLNVDPGVAAQLTYVESLFQTLYGRQPDAGSLIAFVQQLYNGVPSSQLVRQFWNSDEHRGEEVDYYFQVFYHRAPTVAERQAWINIFDAGYSETGVQWLLATSAEYNAKHADNSTFINGLYLDAFGRAANVLEESYWQSYIATNGRAAAAWLILASSESYAHQVNLVYSAWLGRAPTAAETANWVALLQSNQVGVGNVFMNVLGSAEYYNLAAKAAAAAG
jgi:hypothetical protein